MMDVRPGILGPLCPPEPSPRETLARLRGRLEERAADAAPGCEAEVTLARRRLDAAETAIAERAERRAVDEALRLAALAVNGGGIRSASLGRWWARVEGIAATNMPRVAARRAAWSRLEAAVGREDAERVLDDTTATGAPFEAVTERLEEAAARAEATLIRCGDCGARMRLVERRRGTHGAHPDGSPMGTPADARTRRARHEAHLLFDRLWQSGRMRRHEAYSWMRAAMGLTANEAHIGRFTAEECERLRALLAQWEEDAAAAE